MGTTSDTTSARGKLWIVLVGAPIVACTVLSFTFAYDAPYWDEWSYAAPIAHAFEGALTPGDFVVRVNEHIYVVSSLIVIPLARMTHWDLRWEIGAILILYLATFALIVRVLLSANRGSGWAAPVIACALFSGSQYAVWNWGLHVSLASAVFFCVAALVALARAERSWRSIAIAGVCAWAATYSIGGGLGVWPAGAVVLLMRARDDRSRALKQLAVWMAMGVAAVALYIVAGTTAAEISRSAANPLAFGLYVVAFLGGPLAVGNGIAAVVFGLLFLCLVSAWIWRSGQVSPATSILAGLATLAITVALLTALKHAHEGVANAISSRFLPWSTLGWVGLAMAAYAYWPTWREMSRRIQATVAVCVIGVLASSAYGIYKAEERHDAFLLGRRALIEAPSGDDMKFLHPNPESVRPMRELLVRHRLTVFREDAAAHSE